MCTVGKTSMMAVSVLKVYMPSGTFCYTSLVTARCHLWKENAPSAELLFRPHRGRQVGWRDANCMEQKADSPLNDSVKPQFSEGLNWCHMLEETFWWSYIFDGNKIFSSDILIIISYHSSYPGRYSKVWLESLQMWNNSCCFDVSSRLLILESL